CFNGSRRALHPVLAHSAAAINPLAPYFPPFTHFVIIYRENHTFDDYLGDCQTTVATAGQTCNGVVESTNHISSVPNLHTLPPTRSPSPARGPTRTAPPPSRRAARTTGACPQASPPLARGSSRPRPPAGRCSTACCPAPPTRPRVRARASAAAPPARRRRPAP